MSCLRRKSWTRRNYGISFFRSMRSFCESSFAQGTTAGYRTCWTHHPEGMAAVGVRWSLQRGEQAGMGIPAWHSLGASASPVVEWVVWTPACKILGGVFPCVLVKRCVEVSGAVNVAFERSPYRSSWSSGKPLIVYDSHPEQVVQ